LAQGTLAQPAINEIMARIVAAGGTLEDAAKIAQMRTALQPQYSTDAYGREMVTQPGQPPRYTGRQLTPGKEGKWQDLPTLETIEDALTHKARTKAFEESLVKNAEEQAKRVPLTAPQMQSQADLAAAKTSAEKQAAEFADQHKRIETQARDAQDELPQLRLLQK